MTFNNKKTLVFGLMAISLLSFVAYCLGYVYFQHSAPSVPNVSTGATYAINYQGHASYVDKATFFIWRSLGLPAFWVFVVACYLDQKWLITRQSRERMQRRLAKANNERSSRRCK